jgi:uncharacterized protein YyaL (SSP411 family)
MTLLTKAYVDLYITCGDEEYLTKADNCIVEILTHFKSTNTNSIFYNYYSNKSEKLIAEKFELNDSVMPSSNSILCECLMKMGFLNQKPQYTLRGKNMLAHILDSAQNNPLYYSNWLRLYCDYVEFPKAIVKYNSKNIQVDILKNANLPIEKAMIEYVPMSDNQSSFNLLLCVGERCFSPINSIKELKSQMKSII